MPFLHFIKTLPAPTKRTGSDQLSVPFEGIHDKDLFRFGDKYIIPQEIRAI